MRNKLLSLLLILSLLTQVTVADAATRGSMDRLRQRIGGISSYINTAGIAPPTIYSIVDPDNTTSPLVDPDQPTAEINDPDNY
jgi:hypothetical protein